MNGFNEKKKKKEENVTNDLNKWSKIKLFTKIKCKVFIVEKHILKEK